MFGRSFFGASFYGPSYYGSGVSTPTPTPTAARGGDDVPRRKNPNKGFDLKAWKARQPDFEGTIRRVYDELINGPRVEETLDAVAPHIEDITEEAREIDWQALVDDYRAVSRLVELHELQMREEEAIVSLLIH